ncbi:MAG TPA: C40 family peptidase [Streptosporangiaceae bacterium]|nr:C40 family peptidase [Streptosporangiaceae bacterium]
MSVATAVGLALPSSSAGAAASDPAPSLKVLLARANKISNEIDNLGQQYDALRIQLAASKAQLKVAHMAERRDRRLLALYQSSVAGIAAAGYMAGGISPEIQLLETSNPQAMLNRANILTELQQENGTKMNLVAAANKAAERATLLALQEQRQASKLSDEMRAKVVKIRAKENVLNSALYKKALEVYQQTGHYPVHLNGDSIGVQALREALTKVGDPYVWGAAGPNAFDCSGLVVWAYAQIGISLEHFTGDLWNEGEHIARAQLEPGDLVFFFPDIGHVGIYVGNGMMLDAPTFGQPVQVQPVFWNAYVGAVRIA